MFGGHGRTNFIICAIGIFVCFFYFGVIQEKITRGRYGDQVNEDGTIGERFTLTLALVWVMCACNWTVVKVTLLIRPQKEDTTHKGLYACCSLTYLLGMVGSNMALRWVSYPTQVVGKSAKPIPVLLMGVLIGRKSYPFIRYIFVLMIVIGIVLFMYKDDKVSSSGTLDGTGLGELLLFLSLAMDGLTGAVQERIRAASAPSGQQMMLTMNLFGTLMLGAAIIVTGEALDFVSFAVKHPPLLVHLFTLAIAGATGQLFLYNMVSAYGPLAVSIVTTVRKFFTVFFSVIFFGNGLTSRQWMGAIIVFSSLFMDMFYGKGSGKKPTPSKTGEDKKILS